MRCPAGWLEVSKDWRCQAVAACRGERAMLILVFDRVIWIVLDSVGVGEMPDAAAYGDVGSDTLGNIARKRGLRVPNLCRLGLGNLKPMPELPRAASPEGCFGRCTL